MGLVISNSVCEPYAGRAWGTRAMEPLEKDNQLGPLLPVPKQKLAAAEEKRPGQSGVKATSWGLFGQKASGKDLGREAIPTSTSPQIP